MDQSAPPRGGPPLFAVATFWTFVVGGLIFGGIFLSNWHILGAREEPSNVIVAAGPVSVSVPVKITAAQPLANPYQPWAGSCNYVLVPPSILSSIANVVK